MNYINTTTLEYPIGEDQIKQENPNVSFPIPFAPAGRYAEVQPTPKPQHNAVTHCLVEIAPANINGTWVQQWEVQPLDPATTSANLAAMRATLWEEIKRIRDRKTQQGGYKVGSHWYHSDTFSRTQQIGLTIMGAAMPAGLMWKTMGGAFVLMTPTLAQQIFAAAGQQDAALFGYAEALKAQVDEATDPAAVDIRAGWPETFGGA